MQTLLLIIVIVLAAGCDSDKNKSTAPPNHGQMVEHMVKALCNSDLAKDFDPLLKFEIETIDIQVADKSPAYAEMDRMWAPIANKHDDALGYFKGHVTQSALDLLTTDTQSKVLDRCRSRVQGGTGWSDEELLLAIQILFQRSGG